MLRSSSSEAEELQLSIVIPAYNEARKIGADIHAAAEFLRRRGIAGEIIVVDSGSSDDTASIARGLSPQFPELHVLSYMPNRGKGHAVKHGMLQAKGRNILFADAGLCVPYDVATIPLVMLDLNMCDLAHGSRRMRGQILRVQPLYRRIGSRVFKFVVHAFMGVPLYFSDTQCGFKAYRRDVAYALYSEMFTDGFTFDVELILRALRKGYRILEFPVIWTNDPDTRLRPVRASLRIVRELAAIRLGLLFSRR